MRLNYERENEIEWKNTHSEDTENFRNNKERERFAWD